MILLRQHVANVSVLSADVISPFIIFAAFDISPLSVVDEQCSFFYIYIWCFITDLDCLLKARSACYNNIREASMTLTDVHKREILGQTVYLYSPTSNKLT